MLENFHSDVLKHHLCTNSLQGTPVVLLTLVFAESLVDWPLWVSPWGEIREISGTYQAGPNKLSFCLYNRRFHVVSGKMDLLHTRHRPTKNGINKQKRSHLDLDESHGFLILENISKINWITHWQLDIFGKNALFRHFWHFQHENELN